MPLTTAAYFWRETSGVSVSRAAKKLAMKVCRCGVEAVSFVQMRAASVALGSERAELSNRNREMSTTGMQLDIGTQN